MIDKSKEKRTDFIGLIAIILMVPCIATAGPEKSMAVIDACLTTGDSAARVCSTKELSNIVVQCDDGEAETSYLFKYDDLDDPENWPEGQTSPYQGDFSCPEGGVVTAVFVKSGREKYPGLAIDGLSPGTGAIFMPLACTTAIDCSTTDEEDAE